MKIKQGIIDRIEYIGVLVTIEKYCQREVRDPDVRLIEGAYEMTSDYGKLHEFRQELISRGLSAVVEKFKGNEQQKKILADFFHDYFKYFLGFRERVSQIVDENQGKPNYYFARSVLRNLGFLWRDAKERSRIKKNALNDLLNSRQTER